MCLILHLNNHTWKKDYKINFLLKKMRPKSVVLLLCKKLQILEKKSLKKNSSNLFVQIWPSKQCAEFFLNK